MALEPGMAVGTRYRLIAPLASGGMATVWVGEARGSRERVAIKFLMKEVAEQQDVRARFSREATAHLDSVHIVKMFEHGVLPDDTPFIVMELLEGEDLGTRLERQGRLPLQQISQILDEMGAALKVAHAAGIVHRDIKPDNIFLVRLADGSEQVKLLDFGIAKHTAIHTYSVVTATGTMMGTPGYMSPEQVLTGSRVDRRSDLWSTGVVAYHALTGDLPFDGATLGALCVAITRGRYVPPSERVGSLPDALDVWMQRALSVEPEDRFESAEHMAVAFRAAVAGVAPEPSRSQLTHRDHDTVHEAITVIRGRPSSSGSRWWVLSLVALGAAALGGLAVAQWMPAEPGAPLTGAATSSASETKAADAVDGHEAIAAASASGDGSALPSGSASAPQLASAMTSSSTTVPLASATVSRAAIPNVAIPSAAAPSAAIPSAAIPSAARPPWRPRPPAPTAVPTVKDRGF